MEIYNKSQFMDFDSYLFFGGFINFMQVCISGNITGFSEKQFWTHALDILLNPLH